MHQNPACKSPSRIQAAGACRLHSLSIITATCSFPSLSLQPPRVASPITRAPSPHSAPTTTRPAQLHMDEQERARRSKYLTSYFQQLLVQLSQTRPRKMLLQSLLLTCPIRSLLPGKQKSCSLLVRFGAKCLQIAGFRFCLA